MKVSYNWLNNFVSGKLPEAQAVAEALTFHVFEIDDTEEAAGDTVLDVKVTPNRGHDCLSHRGIARELSAILKLPMNAEYDPFNYTLDFSKKSAAVDVSIETPLCKRYIAAHIKGVKVGPSPEWLRQALESIGQRSINSIVDATNLVMFNIGQPMHAFDAWKIKDQNSNVKIEIRNAKTGEKITTLDNKEYELTNSMLVIGEKNSSEAIGIAGVKGGAASSVTEETTDIVLESANFDGISVRKTAQALKFRTDASSRFEQVLSPELTAYGMQQAVNVILAIAGGELEGFIDAYPEPQRKREVAVTLQKINDVLGAQLTNTDVTDVFSRLGFEHQEKNGEFTIIPPFERLDIEIPEDLIEEVGRIVGYDKIAAAPLPPPAKKSEVNKNFFYAEHMREKYRTEGYSEVFTSVFADKGERVVLNKADGVRPYLRESLLPGLAEALEKNLRTKDFLGLKEVKLFEIGTVWRNGKEELMFGHIESGKKGAEMPLAETEAAKEFPDPAEYENVPLSSAERYRTFSKYPFIIRDVAFWCPQDTNAEETLQWLRELAGDLCIKIFLFDRFEKGERVSLAYRLVFQSFDRTLTEEEVQPLMEGIYTALKDRGFEIR